jgi:hypothetical protein
MWDARNYIYKQDFSTNNSFDLRQNLQRRNNRKINWSVITRLNPVNPIHLNKIKTVLSKIINIVPNESVSNIWKINLILKFIIPARW